MDSDKSKISKIFANKIDSVIKIETGISNSNYLVNKKYVVRIKTHKDHFYSYKKEKDILHKTANLYIGERVIYLDKDGNKISDYIPKATIFHKRDDQIVEAAKLIKKLHSCKEKIKVKFEPFHRYSYYKSFANHKPFPHEELILDKVKEIYRKYPLIICHNDLVDNNFLYTKNRSYLIDYEFAGKNIFLFDLASFISENNIKNKDKITLFLNTYGFNGDISELNLMMMFLNLLWYYWAIERLKVTKKEVFKEIIQVKKENILKDIKSLNKQK